MRRTLLRKRALVRVGVCAGLSGLAGVTATALGLLDGTMWEAAAVFGAAGMLAGIVLYGSTRAGAPRPTRRTPR